MNNTTTPTMSETNTKPKKRRCDHKNCNKKLGLIITKCKCCGSFCSTHRLPEDHECSYDYVKYGKEILEKNNPLVIKDKIIPI